jgi:hypothetical protein
MLDLATTFRSKPVASPAVPGSARYNVDCRFRVKKPASRPQLTVCVTVSSYAAIEIALIDSMLRAESASRDIFERLITKTGE